MSCRTNSARCRRRTPSRPVSTTPASDPSSRTSRKPAAPPFVGVTDAEALEASRRSAAAKESSPPSSRRTRSPTHSAGAAAGTGANAAGQPVGTRRQGSANRGRRPRDVAVTATGALPAADIAGSGPSSRVADAFARARAEGRTAIMPFVTAGYPTPERSEEWVLAMVRGGADLIEIGVPFSDPLADGATVQRTSQAALRHGVTLADAGRHGATAARATRCFDSDPASWAISTRCCNTAWRNSPGTALPPASTGTSCPTFPPKRAMSCWPRVAGTGSTWSSCWRRRRPTSGSRPSPSAPAGSSIASR